MAEMEGFESRLKSISGGDGSCSNAWHVGKRASGQAGNNKEPSFRGQGAASVAHPVVD